MSIAALWGAQLVMAADHLDSPAASTNKMADIADVYTWMTADTANVNLALTVSPADDGNQAFGPTVQYVFHVSSHAALDATGIESKIICTFASNTSGQCWLVDPDNNVRDYVNGDFSTLTGRASASGKMRVFAGRRSDPFFFNLSGFLTAANTVKTAGSLGNNAAGCPSTLNASTIRNQLKAAPAASGTVNGPCAVGVKDCFASFNVMAIVVQIDKSSLLLNTDKLLSVWASTHAAP